MMFIWSHDDDINSRAAKFLQIEANFSKELRVTIIEYQMMRPMRRLQDLEDLVKHEMVLLEKHVEEI
jgi:hypothetical protein